MILKDGYIHQQPPAQDPAYPAAREDHQRGTRTKQKQISWEESGVLVATILGSILMKSGLDLESTGNEQQEKVQEHHISQEKQELWRRLLSSLLKLVSTDENTKQKQTSIHKLKSWVIFSKFSNLVNHNYFPNF